MLKADLANNDSNGVVGFILYLILSSFSSVSLFSLSFLYELCSYKVIREGCVTLARAVKVFMAVDPPLVWWEGGITVIAGMRSPNITLLTRFMGLFIASSKTLINNVSHTNDCGRVVKSFLYWNFCSFIPSPLAFTFTMKINCKSSRSRPKLILTSDTLYDYRQPIDQFIILLGYSFMVQI